MEQPVLSIEQANNFAAQYLLQPQIYNETSQSESEDNDENRSSNDKSCSDENNGRIESELFVQSFVCVVFSEEVYEGKCKVWHLAEKILGPNYSIIQISIAIWNQIEAAIQKHLINQKLSFEERQSIIEDKINKAKKVHLIIFNYIFYLRSTLSLFSPKFITNIVRLRGKAWLYFHIFA